MCIRPWAASGASQEYALSMRCGVPSGIDQQVLRPHREAERHAGSGVSGAVGRPAGRLRPGGDRLREGRLVAEAAGQIDRAEQDLQQVQRAAGLEAVGMGRDAAHGVHRDRPADHLLVPAARPVGPRLVEHRSAARTRHGRARRRCGGCVAASTPQSLGDRVGRVFVVEEALGDELEGRDRRRARPAASNAPTSAGEMSARLDATAAPSVLSQQSGSPASSRANRPSSGAAGVLDHQPGRVGVAGR